MNEARVVTLRATVAHLNPTQRAALAAKRLAVLPDVTEITTKATRKGYVLLANNKVILQVDPADALSYQTTVADLAGQWKQAMNEALALPPVDFPTPSVVVGVGRVLNVPVVGRNANWISFVTGDPAVASWERTPAGLLVHGKATGTTTLSAPDGTKLTVSVLPVAAEFPQSITAEVTGTPASKKIVENAIRRTLERRLQTLPNAVCEIVGPIQAAPVGVGESTDLIVHVKATATDALGAEGNVSVTVRNLGIERTSESELWYSNAPERVTKAQDLFRGDLKAEAPVRLLYHHLNDSPQDLQLRVDVLNRTDQVARVAVIPGWAKPNANPVLAGLDAGEDFLRNWLIGAGSVLSVPPHSKVRLTRCRMDHGMTASGLYTLRLLSGGANSLAVNVDAVLREPGSGESDASQGWTPNGGLPLAKWQENPDPKTPEVYPHPFCDEDVSYKVGGNYGFYRIGEKPLASPTSKTPLYGNFGVIYRVGVHIENPTNLPADVEVVFASSAGYSGALFQIDGEVRRFNPLQPQEEVKLMRFRLEPGEKREAKFLTLPLSGSAYPATVVVRAVSKVL